MSSKLLFRDGENLSADFLRRHLGRDLAYLTTPAGIGTGYSPGLIGRRNGASGADPNHFAVIANGATMTLTIRPGYATIQQDNGLSSFDPQAYYLTSGAVATGIVTANATGSTRNDTVCWRIDQTTAPNADGSNLGNPYIVAGQSGGGLSNAPADGALYFPLANVAVANGAVSIAQGNVTDLRWAANAFRARMDYLGTGQSVPNAVATLVQYDTSVSDPNGSLTVGATARYTCKIAGYYRVFASIGTATATFADPTFLALYKNAASVTQGYRGVPGLVTDAVLTVADEIACAAGDYLQAYLDQTSGGAKNTLGNALTSSFTAAWVGPL